MPFMSNTTSLAPSWPWSQMSTSSFTTTPWQWSSGRANIQLGTTPPSIMPSRPVVAVARGVNRILCSATYCPEPIATTISEVQRAQGAAVLAIGTANPASCLAQEEYADWYFRVTKCDHLTKLKAKMKKICQNSGIKKRYFHHSENTLLAHPEFVDHALPSLDARQSILGTAMPELAAAAAARAIAEWGRPATDISHLVFATTSGAHMPGADLQLASLLGLRSSVQRTMMYHNGCHAGSAALRVAKDVAENNRGARVLVATGELTLVKFREPHQDHPETLVMQALFGDGAGAVIVGAGDDVSGGEMSSSGFEHPPLFEMVSASQTLVPNTEDAAVGRLGEGGLVFSPSAKMPALVQEHIKQCLVDAVGPLRSLSGAGGWNDLFWAVHPGGRAILDSVQAALELAPSKLAASRHVLSEFGNVSGASVIFVLDELRRRHDELDGEFGVMLGLGPGLTIETMVLRKATASTKRFLQ